MDMFFFFIAARCVLYTFVAQLSCSVLIFYYLYVNYYNLYTVCDCRYNFRRTCSAWDGFVSKWTESLNFPVYCFMHYVVYCAMYSILCSISYSIMWTLSFFLKKDRCALYTFWCCTTRLVLFKTPVYCVPCTMRYTVKFTVYCVVHSTVYGLSGHFVIFLKTFVHYTPFGVAHVVSFVPLTIL